MRFPSVLHGAPVPMVMTSQETKSLAAFVGWPLLPVSGSRLHPLLPLPQSPVICAGAHWPDQLATALQKLGCWCDQELSSTDLISQYTAQHWHARQT